MVVFQRTDNIKQGWTEHSQKWHDHVYLGRWEKKREKVYSEMLEAGSFIIINCSGKCIFTATFRLVFNWDEWRAKYTMRVTRCFHKEQSGNLLMIYCRWIYGGTFFFNFTFCFNLRKKWNTRFLATVYILNKILSENLAKIISYMKHFPKNSVKLNVWDLTPI